ncbi:hypothetical protein MGYG_01848 [Nannizzia gypsea CBS 118893]|uniref:Uncharacterized protein n=1 Tax=Arthroderma gypseum (strain ATCC MYA-4604 / CBS 118893) TaxID=535722 RepID=E5R3Y7_ARTGP|nr:hypothetical protein MGYG_01848 [Nannizzia gypsea CBS 118893]EFQ98833.1 hypothetical protein MGYG_01848 [Nannizzia gypsea CBS 118893]
MEAPLEDSDQEAEARDKQSELILEQAKSHLEIREKENSGSLSPLSENYLPSAPSYLCLSLHDIPLSYAGRSAR